MPTDQEFNQMLTDVAGHLRAAADTLTTYATLPEPDPVVVIGEPMPRTEVDTSTELDAALKQAKPGDHIVLAAGTYEPFVWSKDRGHQSGTPDLPIRVGPDEGQPVEFTGTGVSNHSDVFRVEDIDHFELCNFFVDNGQFGMRFFSTTDGHISNVTVSDIGHSGIAVQDFSRVNGALTKGEPSSGLTFDRCHVHHTGRICSVDQPYGEAFYIGHGGAPWQHTPNDISIINSDVHHTVGDGVDIKLGSYNIYIQHNKFHDMDTPAGAVISHGPHAEPDPNPEVLKSVRIWNNKMWNIGFGEHGTHAYGISAFAGGLSIRNNKMWAFAYHQWNTRGINLRGLSPVIEVHPVLVSGNTIAVDDSILITYTNGPAPEILGLETNYTIDGAAGSMVLTNSDIVGPMPSTDIQSSARAVGSTIPGSALELV